MENGKRRYDGLISAYSWGCIDCKHYNYLMALCNKGHGKIRNARLSGCEEDFEMWSREAEGKKVNNVPCADK